MKTVRTYLQGCNFCNAVGMVRNWDNFGMGTTQMMKTCPVCNGAKTIIVTETIETDEVYKISEKTDGTF